MTHLKQQISLSKYSTENVIVAVTSKVRFKSKILKPC